LGLDFKRRAWIRLGELALLLTSAGMCLLAVELALRLQPYLLLPYPAPSDGNFSKVLHHNGAKGDSYFVVSLLGRCGRGETRRTRLLFLGDSWVEEGTFARGVSRRLAKTLGEGYCLETVNAGWTSYSPSLYLLKARLVSAEKKPDFIFVNIDDTDFGDEWYRYRHARVRDKEGRLSAVRADLGWGSKLRALARPWERHWHLARLYQRNWLLRGQISALRQRSGSSGDIFFGDYWHIMTFFLSKTPQADYPAESAYFQKTVEEMLAELKGIAGSPARVFVTHHPHYLSESERPGEIRYNAIVSETTARAAQASGVRFIDALGHMEQIHGKPFERFFKWPQDMFSHLTEEGYEHYGRYVGDAAASAVKKELR